jgi:FERM central domain
VLAEGRVAREAAGGDAARLLFKKRMFRETDEAISEPIFISLSFVQAQHDYLEVSGIAPCTTCCTTAVVLAFGVQDKGLQANSSWLAPQGNYPVVMEDAAQMAALQIHAEFGPTLLNNAEAMEGAIERFVTKQVSWASGSVRLRSSSAEGPAARLVKPVGHCAPKAEFQTEHLVQVLMSRPREEWVHNIGSRYKALENFTQEDARLQFLRILRSLPYGVPQQCKYCASGQRRITWAPAAWWQMHCAAMRCRQLYLLLCEAN